MIKNVIIVVAVALFIVGGIALNKQNSAESVAASDSTTKAPRQHSATGVVSVDVKVVDNTIHLLLGKIINSQHSLWYQASNDKGQTWTPAVEATAGLDIAAKFHRGNDARLAVQGDNIVAVWMSRVEGAPHNAGPMMSVRSNDSGRTWEKATMPADWDGPHGFFAMDGNDKQINLVWLDSREQVGKGSQGLRYTSTTDGGVTWLENKTLDQQTCACCWNTARFNNAGQFYVLYRDKHPSDMAVGRVDKEHQWQRLSSVGTFNWDFQGCPHIGGSLAFDEGKQQFHATVSTGHEEFNGVYYLNSTDRGLNWNAPVQLGNSNAVHSDLTVSSGGVLLASWDQITEHGFEVVYAMSKDQGSKWSAQQLISTAGKRASHPRVVSVDNEFLVIWTETDAEGDHVLKTKLIINE